MISAMADDGFPARGIIELLGVSESGYYAWRDRVPSARSLRHAWLTRVILDIYGSSGSTFGYRRIRQELGRRYGISVSHGTVELLMVQAGIRGRAGRLHEGAPPAVSEVSNRRWVVDVFTYRTPKGAVSAAVVLDSASHHLVSWSAAPEASASLIDRALDRAISHEAAMEQAAGTAKGILTGCCFTKRAQALRHGPAPGTIGDWYEHALVEAFWERMHRELTDHNEEDDPRRLEKSLETWTSHHPCPSPKN
ncbi:IS3 family transposase [Streptomyces sp. 6-11-2]|uniref:IS3 family transposase n=1 Tax=Streptomyces sp. 6-11-2 TaxID=2585753 RepID=UPI0011436268|nr:IS3 family transposase [Streptomyces sp. 6-11-2]GED84436.1 transposase [Streptomyces sp. 6-11-2]